MHIQPTILVADDQEMCVTVIISMLEMNGARVLSARDDLEAVEKYERHKRRSRLSLSISKCHG